MSFKNATLWTIYNRFTLCVPAVAADGTLTIKCLFVCSVQMAWFSISLTSIYLKFAVVLTGKFKVCTRKSFLGYLIRICAFMSLFQRCYPILKMLR